jgi:hypothetical protein
MKTNLKRKICLVLSFIFLSFTAPQKEAKAGFLILAATDQFVLNHKYETLDNLIPYIGFATMIPFGFWFTMTGYSMQSLYSGLFVLAEKVDESQDLIKASLLNRYPFLDDSYALDQLSVKILAKYGTSKDQNGDATIVLTEEEINQSVESLDLSFVELNDLMTTLAH